LDDDQDGEWVNVSSGTSSPGSPEQRAVKLLLFVVVVCFFCFFFLWFLSTYEPKTCIQRHRLSARHFHAVYSCLTTAVLYIAAEALDLYIGSQPSDHYFRSVCWFVCLSVCLFVQSFSQPSLIRFRSN